MFYYLSQYLVDQSAGTAWEGEVSGLRLFRYITFRSAGAAVTALLLSLWFGPKVIAWLKELSFGQNYRDRAEVAGNLTSREPGKKFGTPTMGGLLIVLTLNLTTLLWAQWNTLVQLTVVAVVVLAALGFYDDYTKITKASSGGAKSHVKLWVQIALALFVGIYLWYSPATEKLITDIMVPFYQYPVASGAGAAGLVLTALTIVGSSNAV
ncbi:MAG: mraY, partial [Pedosphaera sp.]|nr:mraY [Pedosphaera sp.]